MKLEEISEKMEGTFDEVLRMGKEIGVKTAVLLVPGFAIHELSLIYDALYTMTLSGDDLAQYQAAGEQYMNALREAVKDKHDLVALVTSFKDLCLDQVPFVSREGQMIGQGMMILSPIAAISSALFNKLEDLVAYFAEQPEAPKRKM